MGGPVIQTGFSQSAGLGSQDAGGAAAGGLGDSGATVSSGPPPPTFQRVASSQPCSRGAPVTQLGPLRPRPAETAPPPLAALYF